MFHPAQPDSVTRRRGCEARMLGPPVACIMRSTNRRVSASQGLSRVMSHYNFRNLQPSSCDLIGGADALAPHLISTATARRRYEQRGRAVAVETSDGNDVRNHRPAHQVLLTNVGEKI